MRSKWLEMSLFGACIVRSTSPGGFEITGGKQKAVLVLLATAPFGRRTRAFLQDILWGAACYDTGRQSLRRALSDIKAVMGSQFSDLIVTNNTDVTLDLSKVSFIGRPGHGEFLEGLDIPSDSFNTWLNGVRDKPDQLYSLYSPANQLPAAPMVPTITILPFKVIFGDDQHRVLGDWLAEEVCRSLSRSNLLAVISHLSSRALAAKTIEIKSVRDTLKADYCVTGSLRVSGNVILIDADFIDTCSGRILWTRQFSGSLADFLSQAADGIATIVQSIGQSVADEALAYVRDRELVDIEDHRLLIAGVRLMHRPTLREFARSRELIDEALRRSPASAEIHAWLGKWHVLSVFNGWSTDPQRDTKNAVGCTARALDLDPENAFCLTIDGFAHNNLLRRLDIAETRYEKALSRNPNEALSWLLKGALHAFKDEGQSAVSAADTARRLSPIDPFQYYFESLSATAYLSTGNYGKALDLADRSLSRNNRHLSTLRAKITALHFLGRDTEAKTVGAELIRRQPDFTVAGYLRTHPAADHVLGRDVAQALNAAGIP